MSRISLVVYLPDYVVEDAGHDDEDDDADDDPERGPRLPAGAARAKDGRRGIDGGGGGAADGRTHGCLSRFLDGRLCGRFCSRLLGCRLWLRF